MFVKIGERYINLGNLSSVRIGTNGMAIVIPINASSYFLEAEEAQELMKAINCVCLPAPA